MPMGSKGPGRGSAGRTGRGGVADHSTRHEMGGGAGAGARGGRASAGSGGSSPSSDDGFSAAFASVMPLDPRVLRAAQRAAWRARVARLWQMPLLVLSVVLFGVAAWLFIDPKPGLTIDQKIEAAATFLKQERPEAAIEYLNRLLAKEDLERDREAEIRLLLAEGLSLAQRQKKINVPENHRRIIEQTLTAMELGGKRSEERRVGKECR